MPQLSTHTTEGDVSPKKKLHRSIKAWYEGLSIEAQKHLSHWDIGALQEQALAALEDLEAEAPTRPGLPEDWILRRNASDEPEPEPEPEPPRVRKAYRLGRTQRNILRSMSPRQVYKTREVGSLVDVSPNTASKSLHKLLKAGLVKKVRHGYWKKMSNQHD